MCEIFGVSGKNPIQLNHYLKAFFEHSNVHLHGWGMASFDDEIPVCVYPDLSIKISELL